MLGQVRQIRDDKWIGAIVRSERQLFRVFVSKKVQKVELQFSIKFHKVSVVLLLMLGNGNSSAFGNPYPYLRYLHEHL